MTRPHVVLAGIGAVAVLALAGCSGDSDEPAPDASPSPSASASASGSSAAGDGRAGIAAYRALLTATFSGSQDLDDRAVALAADGVSDPEVMVRRLNAIAEKEGLTFRVRAVAADDVSDISCYEGDDGLWLSSSSGTDTAIIGLGEGAQLCENADARYLIQLAAGGGSGVTVTASDASEDLAGARQLAEVAQELIDSTLGGG
ncbi:hypothetical protein GCM10022215_29930 [Nocardioides fonticola]|uniref:DUF5642 domain-containing protein n=1 Tax=Nocardioides fonticola TaxID=450363 RepID=A0ABP7XPX6_9ACTN